MVKYMYEQIMEDIKALTSDVETITISTIGTSSGGLYSSSSKVYRIGSVSWHDRTTMFSETKIISTHDDFIKLLTITEKNDDGRLVITENFISYIPFDTITSISANLRT